MLSFLALHPSLSVFAWLVAFNVRSHTERRIEIRREVLVRADFVNGVDWKCTGCCCTNSVLLGGVGRAPSSHAHFIYWCI